MPPIDPALYALFCATMALFAVSPGPANLFAVATGVKSGSRAALLGVAGMNTASLVWIAAAAMGLGALAHAEPLLFRAIGLGGAVYVALLALKALSEAFREGGDRPAIGDGASARHAFRDGFIVQLSNPKAVVFFTAVLPPFVDATRPASAQLIILGGTVLIMDVLAMSGYALAGGFLTTALQRSSARRLFSFLVGALLLAAAVFIVLRA